MMKTTMRRLLAVTLALALCLPAAGCGGLGSNDAADDAAFTPKLDTDTEVTLNIIGPLQNFEALEAVINDFMEYYPNCEVSYSFLQDYTSMLPSRLRSDESVDIFMMNSHLYQQTDYFDEVCADLSQEDIDFSAIQDAALESSSLDGKIYALPAAYNASGLIVNETLLENEGLSVPQNYQELLDACATLKQKGYTPIQGFGDGVYEELVHSMTYVTTENDEDRDALFAGEEDSASELLPAYQIVQDMVDAGYMDPEVNATYEDSYNAAILQFFEGDVPFLVATTETFSGMAKRETKSESFSANPFEYRFISSPLAEDGAYSYLEVWYGFSVNENSQQKEWAVEFMRFLATEDEINTMAQTKGLPSVAVESDDDRFQNLYPEDESHLLIGSLSFPPAFDDAIYYTMADVGYGRASASEAVATLEATLREAAG